MTERSFQGTLDSLEPIRDYVAEQAAEAGMDRSAIYKLCLAVDEIATNVVIHGYEEAGLSGDIAVKTITSPGSFEVQLLDHALPYDPNLHEQQPDTGLDLKLEDRRIGGLGILLAKDSVDRLDYVSTPEGNTHSFIMLLNRAGAASNGSEAQ